MKGGLHNFFSGKIKKSSNKGEKKETKLKSPGKIGNSQERIKAHFTFSLVEIA